MSQSLYIERGHIAGAVDFTKYVFEFGQLQMKKNEPTLFDFSVAKVAGVPGWFAPQRGDYVQFFDSRWESRYAPQSYGLLFSGFITAGPNYEFLGVRDQVQYWGYKIKCSSEDYLINAKRVPLRTFINKTRGFILRSLLEEMFEDTSPVVNIANDENAFTTSEFPLDLSGILDGGVERIYTTDPSRYFTEIAAEFAAADGYVYMVLDKHFYYVPELSEPPQGDPADILSIDKYDPRYSPLTLDVSKIEESIVNDLTIIGNDEPTTVCVEQFVSDGYQPSHELTYVPYGLDEVKLIEDDLADEIDANVWQEIDDEVEDYIKPFEGSLNIVGGPGANTGTVYLRARKGIELAGTINTRDGEIYFPPSPTGVGYVGAFYTEDDMLEANMWCGWKVDLGALRITPRGPSGLEPNFVSINVDWHYILRRTIVVDRFYGLPSEVVDVDTGFNYELDPPVVTAKVTWSVDVINTDDPDNIVTTVQDLGTFEYDNPEYAIYAAIVPYDCHLVMNYVSVSRPQQVAVEVDTAPSYNPGGDSWSFVRQTLKVGPSLDGGRCAVEVANGRARLVWYALAASSRALANGEAETTTIPPRGSVITVRYYRNEPARARIRSSASIKAERAKFKDDGVRQLTLTQEEFTVAPRTSEECLFLARAFLADRLRTRYEGSYEFPTKEADRTDLINMIWPGDKVAITIDSPDGEIIDKLDVTNIAMRAVGKETYIIKLDFGPVNKFEQAQRELMRRQHSSLQEISIPDVEAFDQETLNEDGFNPVPDPVPPIVSEVGSDYIQVDFGSELQEGVTGYECRLSDSGWGEGGEVARYEGFTQTFARNQRQVRYFFKAYRLEEDLETITYSSRSALVRHIFPLRNTIEISGITGEWTGTYFKFLVPMPRNEDWARIAVREAGIVIYEGDGLDHPIREDRVTALLNDGHIELNIADLFSASSFTIEVRAIDVLGQEADAAYGDSHTVNK